MAQNNLIAYGEKHCMPILNCLIVNESKCLIVNERNKTGKISWNNQGPSKLSIYTCCILKYNQCVNIINIFLKECLYKNSKERIAVCLLNCSF